jgi:addiction module HigA family antidote
MRASPLWRQSIDFIILIDLMYRCAYRLAKELGVTAPTVNEIVRRRRAVTAEMALRLSRYFGTTAQLWQNLQSQYDLEIASQRIGKRVERGIQPLPRPDLTEPRSPS